jgi:4-hydroxybenzoate polyprenyltransferase
LAVLRLIRFSNTPTAVADIMAGYMLATGSVANWPPLVGLALSSACLYSFGMALNDLYDLDEDRQLNPQRPLVTGQISVGWVRGLLVALGLSAVAWAGLAGWLSQRDVSLDLLPAADGPGVPRWAWPWLIVVPLVLCIWCYDGPLKKSIVAPFLMGGCRGLNLLLGASLPATWVVAQGDAGRWLSGPWELWPADIGLCALAVACYVTGITWYARSESKGPQVRHLVWGFLFLALGVAILAVGLVVLPNRPLDRAALGSWEQWQPWWPLAVLLLTFAVLRKAIVGIFDPTEAKVRAAIITALGSLIFINAAICLYASPQNWGVAVGVVALLIPIKWLRRSIPPT